MRSRTRKTLVACCVTIAIVVALLASLLLTTPYFVHSRIFKDLVVSLVSDRTGGRLDYADLSLELGPHPTLRMYQPALHLPNALDVRAERLTVAINVLPLLRGRVQLLALRLESPRATLSLAGPAPSSPTAANAHRHGDAWSAVQIHRLTEKLKEVAGTAAIEIHDGRLDLLNGGQPLDTWRQIGLTYAGTPKEMKLKAAATSTTFGDVQADLLIEPASLDVDGKIEAGDIDLPRLMAQIRPQLPLTVSGDGLHLEIHFNAQQTSGFEVRLAAALPVIDLQRNQRTIRLEGLHFDVGLQRLSNEVKIDLAALETAKPPLFISGAARQPEGADWTLKLSARPVDIAPVRALARKWAGDLAAVKILFDILRSGQMRSIEARSSAGTLKGLAALKRIVATTQIADAGIRIPKTDLDVEAITGRIDLDQGVLAVRVDSAGLMGTELADGRFRMDLTDPRLPLEAKIGIQTDLVKLPLILSKVPDAKAQRAFAEEIDSLSGTATGDFEIKGPVADLHWAVQVSDLAAHLISPRLPMPVEIETASARYADAGLQVNHLSGRVGHSTIDGLTGNLTFGKRPWLQKVSGRLNLSLGEWFNWAKTREATQEALQSIQTVNGRIAISNLDFTGPLTDPLAGKFHLRGDLLALRATSKRLPGALTLSGGRFQAAADRIHVTDLKATLSDTSLTAAGTLAHPFSDEKSLKASIGGIIGPRFGSWALTQWGQADRVALKHPIALSRLSLVSDLKQTHAISAVLQPVDGPTLTADLRLAPGKVSIPALTVADADSDARFSLERRTGEISARFDGRLDFHSLNLFLKDNVPRAGWVAGDWRATLTGSDWRGIRMTGRLEGGDLAMRMLNEDTGVPLLEHFAMTATGSQLAIQSAAVKWDRMGLALDGWLGRGKTGLTFDLHAKAPFIDGDKLLAMIGQKEPARPPANAPTPSRQADWRSALGGNLRIDIDDLKYGAHHIRPLAAKIHVVDGRMLVEVPQADLCDISLAGSLDMSPTKTKLTLQPSSAARNVGKALACLLRKPIEADGRLYLVGDLEATGSAEGSPADLVNQLNGPVTLTATAGRIYKANLLAKILALVNVTEIFAGQYPGFSAKGMAYKEFELDGRFKNGVFNIDTCSLDSPTLQMTCKGRVDLPDKKIDITVLAAPLKTVDRIIKHLPAIGYVLGGTLISIPIKVEGPVHDPAVVPLSPSAVGEGVLEMMKRTFRLPVKLLEPLSTKP
jgi:hypothetical protein